MKILHVKNTFEVRYIKIMFVYLKICQCWICANEHILPETLCRQLSFAYGDKALWLCMQKNDKKN